MCKAGAMKPRRGNRTVQLLQLAHARSGDKGNTANVGMIEGPVARFELPNLYALNFLLHGALGGGGTISLKTDAQGKVFSTALLRMEIPTPPGFRVR